MEALRASYPRAEFYFLLGEDNLPKLREWHRFEDLQRLVKFVVLDRSGGPNEYPYLTVRRKIDISATTIRNRVASGRSIRYLVPEAVEQIIRREKLYKEGTERSNQVCLLPYPALFAFKESTILLARYKIMYGQIM